MYTTKAKIENYLMTDINASFDTQIAAWIDAAKNYIDRYTGRKDGFESPAVASIKYFDGNNTRELDIDEFSSLTSVEILESNGTDVESTLVEGLDEDYVAYPYNTTPQYRLLLVGTSRIGSFPSGPKRVKVTAKWGHGATVPSDIELAATILVAGTVEQGLKGGKVRSESLGDYSVTFEMLEDSPNILSVNKILDNFKIFTL